MNKKNRHKNFHGTEIRLFYVYQFKFCDVTPAQALTLNYTDELKRKQLQASHNKNTHLKKYKGRTLLLIFKLNSSMIQGV